MNNEMFIEKLQQKKHKPKDYGIQLFYMVLWSTKHKLINKKLTQNELLWSDIVNYRSAE